MPIQLSIEWPVWAASPPGRTVLSWEQTQFDALVGNIFGYHAVQFGLPQLNALRENRISCRTLALDTISGGREHVFLKDSFHSIIQYDFPELPFATQSIDLLVLPHTLELTPEPHRLLREAARTLLPEGQMVMTGFNPCSLWGVRHALGYKLRHPWMPTPHPLIALSRLKDWLKLLGLQPNQGRFGIYAPPFYTERWLNRCHFLEPAGNRWWPIFGAVYIITAIKRAHGAQLIGPAQLNKASPLPAPAPVSSTSKTFKE